MCTEKLTKPYTKINERKEHYSYNYEYICLLTLAVKVLKVSTLVLSLSYMSNSAYVVAVSKVATRFCSVLVAAGNSCKSA